MDLIDSLLTCHETEKNHIHGNWTGMIGDPSKIRDSISMAPYSIGSMYAFPGRQLTRNKITVNIYTSIILVNPTAEDA